MSDPEAWTRLRKQLRYAQFLVNHIMSNRLRRSIRSPHLKPFCVKYHVTDRLHIGPPATDRPLPNLSQEVSLTDTLTLLKKIRKEVRMLYLDGGEPLLHPAITPISRTARQLGFEPLVLKSDFTLIDEHEEVLRHCHVVVVPLESIEVMNQAARWQCDPRWVERLLKNLVHYGMRQEEFGVRIIVKCVIGKENIKEAYDLMKFCFDHNLLFAPTTSADLDLPDRRLQHEPTYDRLVDYIVARRKAGASILGNPESLQRLLAFEDHPCYPTLAPHLAPNGDVFYPCLPEGGVGGNLLAGKTLPALYKQVEQPLGSWHDCRLHGYITSTWVLEHYLDITLKGLALLGK